MYYEWAKFLLTPWVLSKDCFPSIENLLLTMFVPAWGFWTDTPINLNELVKFGVKIGSRQSLFPLPPHTDPYLQEVETTIGEQRSSYDYVNRTGKELVVAARTSKQAENIQKDVTQLNRNWEDVTRLCEDRKALLDRSINELRLWLVCAVPLLRFLVIIYLKMKILYFHFSLSFVLLRFNSSQSRNSLQMCLLILQIWQNYWFLVRISFGWKSILTIKGNCELNLVIVQYMIFKTNFVI